MPEALRGHSLSQPADTRTEIEINTEIDRIIRKNYQKLSDITQVIHFDANFWMIEKKFDALSLCMSTHCF